MPKMMTLGWGSTWIQQAILAILVIILHPCALENVNPLNERAVEIYIEKPPVLGLYDV
jgi:hypothetical protein